MQALVEYPISTYLPREVVYSDGTFAILTEDFVLNEGNLKLFVPVNKVGDVVTALRRAGFADVGDSDGSYSLSMNIFNIWDLHVRVSKEGFITAHFEVVKGLLEQGVSYPTIPSVYEPFEFYRAAYDRIHIYDAVSKRWVKSVRGHYLVTLQPPHALGVWTPVQVSLGGSGVVGTIAYALSRLEEGSRMGNGNNWDDRTRKVFT